ncbi:MAG TPA: glycerophosphodiester phosphodiesterase family protein [Myxococcota bacterium]|nr:glycerophosphodiester phosphodiesterase family protein [Myxococcota bacterium]
MIGAARAGLRAACAGLALAAAAALADPHVIAHRGGAGFPENSLAACRAALALGAGCELDVRSTRDGALVLMHDATISRTTAGRGRVRSLALAQLRDLYLRGEAGLSAERVPTLAQALGLPFGERVLLLDLKEETDAFHTVLAKALASGAPRNVRLGVRSEAQARALRARLPDAEQVAFIDEPDEIERFARGGAGWIRLWDRWLAGDASLAARVRAAGASVLIGLERRDAPAARAALAHAPHALLCDAPGVVLEVLGTRAAARRIAPQPHDEADRDHDQSEAQPGP